MDDTETPSIDLPIVYGSGTLVSGTVQTSGPSATDQLVDAWFVETFHGIPLATEFFNRFSAARDELKKRLAKAKE